MSSTTSSIRSKSHLHYSKSCDFKMAPTRMENLLKRMEREKKTSSSRESPELDYERDSRKWTKVGKNKTVSPPPMISSGYQLPMFQEVYTSPDYQTVHAVSQPTNTGAAGHTPY